MSSNNSGFSSLSNRQKRLELQNALSRDPNTFKNQTPFRAMERKYKQRVPQPDFSSLINFHNIDSIPEQYRNKIVLTKLKKPLNKISPEFGSKLDNTIESKNSNLAPGTYGYTIKGFPGFIIIPNPFTCQAQRTFVKKSLKGYTKPPYISNLNTHYLIPPCGVWDLYEREFYKKISVSSDDFFVPLKLDPLKVKNGDEKVTSIETSTATQGYSYNGLNEKGEVIKNSHLKELPPGSLFKRIRWITFGFQYHWPTKNYILQENHHVPLHLAELSNSVVEAIDGITFLSEESEVGYIHKYPVSRYKPEGGVFNFYQLKDSLMGHIDKSEPNLEAPLISFSFGLDGVFLVGGKDQNSEPIPIVLKSGDIVAMCGPCRKAYHGVPRIIEDTLPSFLEQIPENDFIDSQDYEEWGIYAEYLSTTRINANTRQVF